MRAKSKLNIDKTPERFSRTERAIHFNNMVADEIAVPGWKVQLPLESTTEWLGVPAMYLGPQDGAFLHRGREVSA